MSEKLGEETSGDREKAEMEEKGKRLQAFNDQVYKHPRPLLSSLHSLLSLLSLIAFTHFFHSFLSVISFAHFSLLRAFFRMLSFSAAECSSDFDVSHC